MRKQKYYLRLTGIEHRFIIQCLLEYTNKLVAQSKYTDGVNKVIVKYTKPATGTGVNLSCLLLVKSELLNTNIHLCIQQDF